MMCSLLASLLLISLAAVFSDLADVAEAAGVDKHEMCQTWAASGECEANPGYMRKNCQKSCDAIDEEIAKADEEISHIHSFFDLEAKDIDGELIKFERFRGRVTIIVNVASFCGRTESHYRGLVALYNDLVTTDMVEILAFPCNQFGNQEPEECSTIKNFAQSKGAEFQMMDKIDVNGPKAHAVYKYLKKTAGPSRINWNFDTYYVISPDGKVDAFNGIEPSELKDVALELIDKEL